MSAAMMSPSRGTSPKGATEAKLAEKPCALGSRIEGIPQEPLVVRLAGRTLAITPKAFETYAEEYGLGDGIPFDFEECFNHILSELTLAMQEEPVALSKRRPLSRVQSGNLIFKLKGSYITSIRISLKYNSRNSLDDDGFGFIEEPIEEEEDRRPRRKSRSNGELEDADELVTV